MLSVSGSLALGAGLDVMREGVPVQPEGTIYDDIS